MARRTDAIHCRRCPRPAFTVPELLAVIAVIMIIIALLLPALGKARDAAKAAVCKSNEHQLGLAIRSYGLENDRYFPVGVMPGTGEWLWPPALRRHAPDLAVFNCTTDDEQTRWVKRSNPGSPAHPSGWEKDEYRLGAGRGSFFSYGMNVWGAPCCADAYGTGTYYNHATLGERKMTTMVAPSNFIVLGDSNWDTTVGGDVNWSAYIGMYALRQYPLEVHQGKANILHGDGHVEAMPRTDFVTFSADPTVLKRWHRDNQAHWPQ